MTLSDHISDADTDNLLVLAGLTQQHLGIVNDIYKFAMSSLRDLESDDSCLPGKLVKAIADKVDTNFPDSSIILKTLIWEAVCRKTFNDYQMEVVRKKADAFSQQSGMAQAIDRLNGFGSPEAPQS